MLKLVCHSDVASFVEAAAPYLNQDEVTHNVLIGITARWIQLGRNMDFLAHVENAKGEVVAATMRTSANTGAVLSNIADEAALPLLVEAFGNAFDTLPTVLGRPEEASRFAELWQQAKGQAYHTKMEEGIYRLDTLIPPNPIKGESRPADKEDIELLISWILGFDKDTGLNETTPELAVQSAEAKTKGETLDRMWLWTVDSQPVSMATSNRKTPHGASIGPVYTPKEHRGNGYGSAITAALSQAILDSGKQFAYLYTDMSNPTSNKIYQAIGYHQIGSHRLIAFE